MAKTTPYQTLITTLGDAHQPMKSKEKDQAYLARLARDASQLDDDTWDTLPGAVQDWVEAAAAALENKTELPPCPGRPADAGESPAAGKTTKKKVSKKPAAESTEAAEEVADEDEGEEVGADDEEEAAPVDKTPKKKVSQKKAAKSKPEKASRSPGDPVASPTGRTQQLVVEHPDWDESKLMAQLKKEKLEIAAPTFKMNVAAARRVLRMAAEFGHLKPAIAKMVA